MPRHMLASTALMLGLVVVPEISSQAANAPAFVAAAVADQHRPKSDTDRDADRLPAAMLTDSGIKPGYIVAELVPAQGYATRLLSAAVGPKGRIYSLNLAKFADRIKDQIKPVLNDPAYANVSVSDQDFTQLKLPERADVVWTSQNYHDFKNPGMFYVDTLAMDKAIFAALKPGGLFVVIDHAAAAGSGVRDTGAMHRIDAAVVKAEAKEAGFVLAGESKALANPNDPHTGRITGQGGVGDKSDKFFLKFRKPK